MSYYLKVTGKATRTYLEDENCILVHIPIKFINRKSKSQITTPDGRPALEEVDPALRNALVRAHRWLKALETGKEQHLKVLAQKEGITSVSYASRILRLTTLSPEIQEAIIDGRSLGGLTLADFMKPFPLLWSEQKKALGIPEY
ncbi:hypothetical protein [Endozoicomonas sp. ISHI1]|uniref:hypothetical protein n=1 Tax=Endozoicomonas sp. ISHI1 TaxID=2825882 RepID=UPI0021489A6A|nr:hypothetical protein [Endozoicomonas sp. ISHI1]